MLIWWCGIYVALSLGTSKASGDHNVLTSLIKKRGCQIISSQCSISYWIHMTGISYDNVNTVLMFLK